MSGHRELRHYEKNRPTFRVVDTFGLEWGPNPCPAMIIATIGEKIREIKGRTPLHSGEKFVVFSTRITPTGAEYECGGLKHVYSETVS